MAAKGLLKIDGTFFVMNHLFINNANFDERLTMANRFRIDIKIINMKKIIFIAAVLVSVLGSYTYAQDTNKKKTQKAVEATKETAEKVGDKVADGTKKAGKKIKKGAKKVAEGTEHAYDATKEGVKKGAHKVADGTEKAYDATKKEAKKAEHKLKKEDK